MLILQFLAIQMPCVMIELMKVNGDRQVYLYHLIVAAPVIIYRGQAPVVILIFVRQKLWHHGLDLA